MSYHVLLSGKECGGDCPSYKRGDKITFRGEEVKDGRRLCLYTLSSFFPYAPAFCRTTPKKDEINYNEKLHCPKKNRPVNFAIERQT